MRIERGNLWDRWDAGDWIVITTNIGWDRHGANNMGAGMALQAACRFPALPRWYGRLCRDYGKVTPVLANRFRMLFFPVKPLIEADPERSWDQKASPVIIGRSAHQLREMMDDLDPVLPEPYKIAMALPGCGNGGLDPSDVMPILEKYIGDHPRFALVDRAIGSA